MTDRTRRSSRQAKLPASTPAGEALQTLTRRELEVLGLVATGQTSRSIAAALEIKLPTVKRHLRNIYRKLGAANRVQASNIYHLGHPQGSFQQPPQS
jgi:DNA-binding CsgD family transcriptional regulator